jgi:hypothetical protein
MPFAVDLDCCLNPVCLACKYDLIRLSSCLAVPGESCSDNHVEQHRCDGDVSGSLLSIESCHGILFSVRRTLLPKSFAAHGVVRCSFSLIHLLQCCLKDALDCSTKF